VAPRHGRNDITVISPASSGRDGTRLRARTDVCNRNLCALTNNFIDFGFVVLINTSAEQIRCGLRMRA
jgi:hypothetical protein